MGKLFSPQLPLGGDCPCEAVRFSVNAMPLLVYACHCADCRRSAGSAFSMAMPVMADSFALTRGQPKSWRQMGSSGVAITHWFCGECGGRLYGVKNARNDVVVVRAGTLDDASWLRPIAHIYLQSAQAWERIPNQAERFDIMPEDFAPLSEKWQRMWQHSPTV